MRSLAEWVRLWVGVVVCVRVLLSCIDLCVSLFGGCVLKGFLLPSQVSLHIFIESFSKAVLPGTRKGGGA